MGAKVINNKLLVADYTAMMVKVYDLDTKNNLYLASAQSGIINCSPIKTASAGLQ